MRKFPFFVLFAIVLCAVSACTTRKSEAVPPIVHVEAIPEEQTPQSFTEDVDVDETENLKEQSYVNFKGKTMDVILADDQKYVVDLAKFFKMAGLKYVVEEDQIVVAPEAYNNEADFMIKIRYDATRMMIYGDIITTGRQNGGTWKDSRSHESATDFIFDAVLGEQKLQIGADELDYLWREIRLLTAPADKADEINAEIDAEFASYYVDTLPGE